MALDLARFKAHLSIDWDPSVAETAMLAGMLAGAKRAVEAQAQSLIEEREVVQRFDAFTDRQGRPMLRLAWAPVVSVEGIDYLDAVGLAATITEGDGEFRIVAGIPCLLLPPTDAAFPTPFDGVGSVAVRYTAGFADGEAPDLDMAVLMLGAHYYHNREAVVTGTIATELPMGVAAICNTYRHTLI